MDCKTARLLLDFHRPQTAEMLPDDAESLEHHLSLCSECNTLAQTERNLDRQLGKAMRDVAIPKGLRETLLDRLALERRASAFRKLAWAGRGAAIAAALLLAVYLGWKWWQANPPELNLAALRDREFHQMNSPVEEWFLTHEGVHITPPRQFNYHFLVHHGMTRWQGQRVPYLVFVHGEVRASVYIVTSKDFDLDALPADPSVLDTAGFYVRILRDAEHPDTAYIVIYNGATKESLEPLLVDEAPA